MIARPSALLGVLLAASPAAAQTIREDPRDIPYFERHHAERNAVLRQCQTDVRLAQSATCQNAEAAGAGQLGKPLPRNFADQWRYPRAVPLPPAKGPLRGT